MKTYVRTMTFAALAAGALAAPADAVMLRNPNSGLCIDVPGGRNENGVQLIIWTCQGSPNQQFEPAHEPLKVMGKCMSADGGRWTQGNRVILWDCVPYHPSQSFSFLNDGRVVGLHNLCLDVPRESRQAGTGLQLWPCNGGRAQLWQHAHHYSNVVVPVGTSGTSRVYGYRDGQFLGWADIGSNGIVAAGGGNIVAGGGGNIVAAGGGNLSVVSVAGLIGNDGSTLLAKARIVANDGAGVIAMPNYGFVFRGKPGEERLPVSDEGALDLAEIARLTKEQAQPALPAASSPAPAR